MAQLNKAKYLKRLEIESENNSEINQKQKEFYDKNFKNEIEPISQYSTTAEELADRTLQRDKAFQNLLKITTQRDAGVITSRLQDAGEIDDFNRFFSPFSNEIKGQSNISPTTFDLLWDRYKTKLRDAAPEGIAFEDPLQTEAKRLKLISDIGDEVFSSTLKSKKYAAEAIALANYYDLMSLSAVDLKPIFDSVMTEDEEKERKILITTDIKPPNRMIMKLKEQTAKGRPETYYNKPKKAIQAREIVYRKTGVLLLVGTGVVPVPPNVFIPEEMKCSCPLKKKVLEPEPDNIPPRQKKNSSFDKYAKFGKYIIHIPSLNDGYINIKYKTRSKIKNFPKKRISSEIAHLINYILRDGQFPSDLYLALSDKDKKQFDEIITFSRLNDEKGLDFLEYNSSMAKERDRDINRFDLLRGEIMAGNNNPVHIKELKMLVFKMARENSISKSDFNEVMYMLALI